MHTGSDPRYSERLVPSAGWWAAGALVGAMAAAVALVPVVILGARDRWLLLVLVVWALATLGTWWALWAHGRRIRVDDAGFSVGRAHLPAAVIGDVEAYDGIAARAEFGPGADARAYLVLRSYCRGAVKVRVDDDADPTPYWLVSTRRPELLAHHLGAISMQD